MISIILLLWNAHLLVFVPQGQLGYVILSSLPTLGWCHLTLHFCVIKWLYPAALRSARIITSANALFKKIDTQCAKSY